MCKPTRVSLLAVIMPASCPQMEIEEKVAKALLAPLDSEPDVPTQQPYLLKSFPVLDASLAKLHSSASLENAKRSPLGLRVWQ